jgi:hypothetical protein
MATEAARTETSDIALTLQFLDFVAIGTRIYGDTMEAWRSICPRLSIWEEAVRDGLVRSENGGAMKSSRIVLIDRGRAQLMRDSCNGSGRRGRRRFAEVDENAVIPRGQPARAKTGA